MSETPQFQMYVYDSFSVGFDGVVTHVHEDKGGRTETKTPLYDSPIRGALPEWAWDLVMDPRNDGA